MSALTDLFTSIANKIRSKTGGSGTYTPTEMVSAVDDVYDAGYADATTPITPSDSSPASMTSGTGYKPTANGYAISSYANKTPSDETPVSLSSGSIVKIGGAGYAIESYRVIAPNDTIPESLLAGEICKVANAGYAIGDVTSVTPSNSTPPSIQTGKVYKSTSRGQLILSSTALTPSDSSPASISDGTIYKADGAGYAIESQPSMLSPSDSSPSHITSGAYYYAGGEGYAIQSNPTAMNPQQFTTPVSVYNGNIIKLTGNGKLAKSITSVTPSDNPSQSASGTVVVLDGSGYVYRSPENFKFGTVADKSTASEEFSIDTGLSSISKFIMWGRNRNDDRTPVIIYDSSVIGSNKFSSAGIQTGSAAQRPTATIGDNSTAYNGSIKSISDGTVTIKQASSLDNIFATGIQWVAKP